MLRSKALPDFSSPAKGTKDITKLDQYGKRTIAVLFTAQSLFSAGNIMLFTISSILAVRMGRSTLWTGVPMTLILGGAALGAWPMGRFMDRYGRRRGLAVGQFCGMAGALTAGVAVIRDFLPLFLGGMFLLGFARGILDMGRYAAADANPPRLRARAISLVVLGGTAGAVAGPPLLKLVTAFETTHCMTAMAGPWFAMAGILCLCFLLVFTFLRPDPLEIAQARAKLDGSRTETNIQCRELPEIIRDRRFFLAVAAIVCGHLVMYLVMTITPVFMHECHHGITEISWVIFAHMFGMYGLSFFVGWLIDRAGRQIMIAAGCLVLIASCLMAPMYNGTLWLALVLFLVGLGWNCCFVSGSTLLSDLLQSGERGRVQGLVDTLVNVSAATGSLGSGFLFSSVGFSVMVWISLVVALIPILLMWWLSVKHPVSIPSANAETVR